MLFRSFFITWMSSDCNVYKDTNLQRIPQMGTRRTQKEVLQQQINTQVKINLEQQAILKEIVDRRCEGSVKNAPTLE